MKNRLHLYIYVIVVLLISCGCSSSTSISSGMRVNEVPDTRVTAINNASEESDLDLRLRKLFRLQQHQENIDPVLLNARAVTHLQRGDHSQAIELLREAASTVTARNHYLVSTNILKDMIAHTYTGTPVYQITESDMRQVLRAMKTEILQGRKNHVANTIMYGNFDVSTPILYPNSNAIALVLQALHEQSETEAFGPLLISYLDPANDLEKQINNQVQVLAENMITAGILDMDVSVIIEAVELAETVPLKFQTTRLRYVVGTAKYLVEQEDWIEYVTIRHRSMFP